MYARQADADGFVERDGVKIHYEVHGNGDPTILLLPTWTLVHKRFWKMQLAYLAHHHRVVTYDGPGNGRSDRPLTSSAYDQAAQVAYALAVLDATCTDHAVVVGLSKAANWALELAAEHGSRVLGTIVIGPSLPITPWAGQRADAIDVDGPPPKLPASRVPYVESDPPSHWAKYNKRYWLTDHEDFVWFFIGQCFSEPYSTKPIEDAVSWACDTTGAVLVADHEADSPDRPTIESWCSRITSPLLAIHGDDDRISPISRSERLAELTGGQLVTLAGSGHIPLARDPVRVNLLIHDFAERLRPRPAQPQLWRRWNRRAKRAL